MSDWVYDLETYPNIFTFAAYNPDEGGWVFEISDRKNDKKALRGFLRSLYKNKDRMIGFNNVGFDYPLVHYFIKNKECTYEDLYEKAMSIIETQNENKFANTISRKKEFIEQVDLYKIHHFDNKAKATSLKMIEFNMRSDNIEDLPFDVGVNLNDEQKEVLIKYNEHDVMETYKFYIESLPAIRFREELSAKYKKDFMNHNDTKIGKDYFVMQLEKEDKNSCYTYLQGGGRKINQTKRDSIALKDCIFPYVKFNRKEFQAVKNWLERQVITETKGVFTDIPEHELGELANYCNMVQKNKKLPQPPSEKQKKELLKDQPCGWFEDRELKSGKISHYFCWRIASNLNVVVDGFQYDFGTGGIHGSVESQILESTKNHKIIDYDVASYYPNLAIKNRIYPEHLGEKFCDIYEDVYKQRKQYPKGTPENAVMKLALNGTYGASNDQYSPFYDPMFTMAVTINGQLSLCMLAEELIEIDDVSMVQVNTDGLTVMCPSEKSDYADELIKLWEKTTNLEMERADYSKMIIRDVNNYISVYEDGNVKRKGAYEFDGLGWHQNQSSLVIKKAAYEYLTNGKPIDNFIKTHDNKYDFMLRTKVPRSSRLVTVSDEGVESVEQNICRYYIANDGEHLVKIMPPVDTDKYGYLYKNPETEETMVAKTKGEQSKVKKKGFTEYVGEELLPKEERRIGINTGWKVKTCNNINDFDWDIDYTFYIKEANKLVEVFFDT